MNEFVKKDCFAYKNGKCTALNELYCKEEECRFYKTRERLLEEKLKNKEM